jgi:hypothetical protein
MQTGDAAAGQRIEVELSEEEIELLGPEKEADLGRAVSELASDSLRAIAAVAGARRDAMAH